MKRPAATTATSRSWIAQKQTRGLALALAIASGGAAADSCIPFLGGAPGEPAHIALISLNKAGAATYLPLTRIEHLPHLKVPSGSMNAAGGDDPEMFKTYNPAYLPTREYLSTGGGTDPFASSQGQQVAMTLTVEPAPKVILAFTSQGSAKAKFELNCTANGLMHGSTPDADYLIVLKSDPSH